MFIYFHKKYKYLGEHVEKFQTWKEPSPYGVEELRHLTWQHEKISDDHIMVFRKGYVVSAPDVTRICKWCSIRKSSIHGLGWFAERDFGPFEGVAIWQGEPKQPNDATDNATMVAKIGSDLIDASETGPPFPQFINDAYKTKLSNNCCLYFTRVVETLSRGLKKGQEALMSYGQKSSSLCKLLLPLTFQTGFG
eukprot:m.113749 g.113749  ORF g.113749 m.113749 type:complete len:193 (+) comp14146_c0_seq8:415-993(+)